MVPPIANVPSFVEYLDGLLDLTPEQSATVTQYIKDRNRELAEFRKKNGSNQLAYLKDAETVSVHLDSRMKRVLDGKQYKSYIKVMEEIRRRERERMLKLSPGTGKGK